ncbi:nuclease [Legionella rubrilucens]|uniref:Nuclease n=1 Tax=Legionella rubrilucens TaxID=458 RepID=A0A0W0XQK3_9GAMM|nr:GIY-YIG nuclease family protein [Legionella rubrilucens]KTD47009.1 nuclease [Legionella rubrilucens]
MTAYTVYMLRCENGSLYTGYTTHLERRYQAHLAGKCKYTRSFKPVEIAAHWQVFDKSAALKLERFIKTLSRQEKEALLTLPSLCPFMTNIPDKREVEES